MSVPANQQNRYSYAGDGATTTFAYNSVFEVAADLLVYTWDTVNLVASKKTLNTDYTVTGGNDATGSVVFGVAPAAGFNVIIIGAPAVAQAQSLSVGGNFPPTVYISGLDVLTLLVQRNSDLLARAARMADWDTGTFDPTLPYPRAPGDMLCVDPTGTKWGGFPSAAARAGQLLAFDNNGNPITAAPSTPSNLTVKLPAYASDAAYVAALGAPSQGTAYWNTTTQNVRHYDGATWQNEVTELNAVTLQNKDFQGGVAANNRRFTCPGDTFTNISALTRKAGTLLYATDKQTLFLDTGAALAAIGGGGGSSLLWRLVSNAPDETTDLTANALLEFLDFNQNDSQAVYAQVQVPSQYVVGTQITLRGGLFACSLTVGNVKFNALVSLIQVAGTTVLGTYNQRNSTNTQVAVPGVANTFKPIGNVDLTDATGKINGVAVQPNDTLLIQFFRDCVNETSGAAGLARLVRFGMIPQFN